ncbi:MAG: hypothetical protein DDT32_01220 [Syntrophomonadaceae bacterium]|nr:hypothetical protein [Bacillota bacterium]MBT9147463.1 hypothetical protein [Bacillota bacterium]
MYLIGIKAGQPLCGNAGTLISRYKRESKLKTQAHQFAHLHALDEVYGIQNYSQKMCEMSHSGFVDHVRQTGVRYI